MDNGGLSMNEKIQKCHTCYYDNKCYWQELADHIPTDCGDYKKEDKNWESYT